VAVIPNTSPDLTPLADPGRTICLPGDTAENEEEEGPLDELDVAQWLVFKKPEEEGPEIRGGHIDALIVHATKANKNGKFKCTYS
jgi:hypothetical protein